MRPATIQRPTMIGTKSMFSASVELCGISLPASRMQKSHLQVGRGETLTARLAAFDPMEEDMRPILVEPVSRHDNSKHRQPRSTTVAVIAFATTSLFLGVPPANAGPTPGPTDQTVAVQDCPSIDALARPLRIAGFSAQAINNYAVLAHRDCIKEI
jgi:hypothetical protein